MAKFTFEPNHTTGAPTEVGLAMAITADKGNICDGCGEENQSLFSPFDDQKYGHYCDVCLDGMEGDIAEREEYDSLADDY